MSTTQPLASSAMSSDLDIASTDSLPANQVYWAGDGSKKAFGIGMGVGVLGVLATLAGIAMDRGPAFGSYLVAYMLMLSLALGSLFFVILHHITGAKWSVTLRRLAEGTASTLPLFAILFIPVVIGMKDLFVWSRPEVVEVDKLVQDKAGYLNTTFFLIRAVVYFAVWSLTAIFFAKRSLAQDAGDAVAETKKMRRVAPVALLLYGITVTFAAFDWLMSISPHWFSTIFGVYFFSGAIQGFFALMIVLVLAMHRIGRLHGIVTIEHLHDLGKFLFGFTVFFAYIAFCQYFLIWYANIPEETFWYLERWGDWAGVSVALIAFTFVLPFVLLMARAAKRNTTTLLLAAIVVLIGRAIDIFWLVMPSLLQSAQSLATGTPVQAGPAFSWTLFTALLGIGGLFVAFAARKLGSGPLIPIQDPHLRNSLGHENV